MRHRTKRFLTVPTGTTGTRVKVAASLFLGRLGDFKNRHALKTNKLGRKEDVECAELKRDGKTRRKRNDSDGETSRRCFQKRLLVAGEGRGTCSGGGATGSEVANFCSATSLAPLGVSSS